ncbi:MAG TPA: hypothetical protein VHZ50_10520 [Puia sp.]|nr:hypothetical protein [Puia sp.]
MLNLRHYIGNSIEFLRNVIDSKRNSKADPSYKSRIEPFKLQLKATYEDYDLNFANDTLESLVSKGYSVINKEDLLSLYAYSSAPMQALKTNVTKTSGKRVISTCQNCTIGEVNSFDHVVTKNLFPEYSVHPKNLFPSCVKCNGYKSKFWQADGERLFLNLYMDKLPKIQYLFVEVIVRPLDIDAIFSIENRNDVEQSIFNKISYHYDKLHLCQRFSENIDKVVTPLIHTISSNLKFLTLDEAVDVALNTVARNRESFGCNYWKSILEISLLSSPDFLEICTNAAAI